MTRIIGIDLKDKDTIGYALTNIKGIGWSTSKKILSNNKIDPNKRVKELSKDELTKITNSLDNYTVEGELLRLVKSNITRLQTIGTYKGIRHNRRLPVRGQRTKSNARTKRGSKKTVGTYRKDALTKMQQQKKEE